MVQQLIFKLHCGFKLGLAQHAERIPVPAIHRESFGNKPTNVLSILH